MGVKIGINGFGRIGRLVFRAALAMKKHDLDFVAVNDLTDSKTLAHLLKYDSNFGILPNNIKPKEGAIVIDGKEMKVLAEKDPAKLPWKELGVNIVVESTGRFTQVEKASVHLQAGAKKVIISAPAKGECPTFVIGVNESDYDPKKHDVISNASCTTNCLAPVAKVILDEFGIEKGLMTTIHSYTNDQNTLDFPHKDLRRTRAAAVSMIPTTTGAAKAIGLVIPELKGKMDGLAIRVPTPDVSLVDLTVEAKKEVSADEVNAALEKAANGKLKGILEACKEPLVSRDFLGNPASSIADLLSTKTFGNMIKVLSWYDNEWAYSCRIVDFIEYMVKKGL